MKFASFETIVELIYKYLPGKKTDYSKGAQTGVAFTGGYIAGILCAAVSHPADVMVSKLNANRQPGEAFGAAMGRIYKEIGFAGLWNGLPVRIVMIGTLVSGSYTIYQVKLIAQCCIDGTAMDDVCHALLLPWPLWRRHANAWQLRLLQDFHGSSHHRGRPSCAEEGVSEAASCRSLNLVHLEPVETVARVAVTFLLFLFVFIFCFVYTYHQTVIVFSTPFSGTIRLSFWKTNIVWRR